MRGCPLLSMALIPASGISLSPGMRRRELWLAPALLVTSKYNGLELRQSFHPAAETAVQIRWRGRKENDKTHASWFHSSRGIWRGAAATERKPRLLRIHCNLQIRGYSRGCDTREPPRDSRLDRLCARWQQASEGAHAAV